MTLTDRATLSRKKTSNIKKEAPDLSIISALRSGDVTFSEDTHDNCNALERKLLADISFLTDRLAIMRKYSKPNNKVIAIYEEMLRSRQDILVSLGHLDVHIDAHSYRIKNAN